MHILFNVVYFAIFVNSPKRVFINSFVSQSTSYDKQRKNIS